jgi:chemotaxis protein methyltransferase CheR
VDAALEGQAAPFDANFDIEMKLLLDAIYMKYQHDFRNYAQSSMRRRLALALQQLGCATLSQLQDRVLREPALFPRLLQFLTVQVSDMFRDPQYFRTLREQVIPELSTYPSIKVWVAGCATGEELWSLAILFTEEGLAPRTLFYATDINPDALRASEAAVYDLDRVAGFSRNYIAAGGRASLADYYVAAYGGAAFGRSLECQVLFADHSLATDSVFSEMQFISCRNVLIYFDRTLQDRVLGLFAEALPHGGFLGLGSRESLRFSSHSALFADLCAPQRIFRRL